MKQLLLTIFLAVVIVAAAPLDNNADPVQLIVNGAPEGKPIDLGDIVNLKLKEKVNGEVVSSSDLLYPLSSQAFAEAAAAAALEDENQDVIADVVALPDLSMPEVVLEAEVIPDPIVLPAPVTPAVVPEPIVLPSPAAPEVVPEPIALPSPAAPEVVSEAIALPAPATPEVVPEPVVLPSPPTPEVADSEISYAPVIVVPSPVLPENPPQTEQVEILPSPSSQHNIYNDGMVSVQLNSNSNVSYLQQMQNWAHVVINYFFDDHLHTADIQ